MYHDYRYRFPASGLAQAFGALDVLRTAGILEGTDLPANMLGDPILQDGKAVAFGRAGRGAMSYADPDTGQTVDVPAAGDPAMVYIHIRSAIGPEALPAGFDPAGYGLVATVPGESAAVLGIWA